MLCPGNFGAQTTELSEDGIGGGGPRKRVGIFVKLAGKLLNAFAEMLGAAKGITTDGSLGDQTEPALDLIEPGRVSGNKVRVKPRVANKPTCNLGVSVRGVVIHYYVHG